MITYTRLVDLLRRFPLPDMKFRGLGSRRSRAAYYNDDIFLKLCSEKVALFIPIFCYYTICPADNATAGSLGRRRAGQLRFGFVAVSAGHIVYTGRKRLLNWIKTTPKAQPSNLLFIKKTLNIKNSWYLDRENVPTTNPTVIVFITTRYPDIAYGDIA
jgi:hypothetical protein